MASFFGHAVAAVALGKTAFNQVFDKKIGLLAALCAAAPDLDVAGFLVGIKYSSQWGHRGFTHSLVFAAIFGWFVAWLFYRKTNFFDRKAMFLILSTASTASHGLLDLLNRIFGAKDGRGFGRIVYVPVFRAVLQWFIEWKKP